MLFISAELSTKMLKASVSFCRGLTLLRNINAFIIKEWPNLSRGRDCVSNSQRFYPDIFALSSMVVRIQLMKLIIKTNI